MIGLSLSLPLGSALATGARIPTAVYGLVTATGDGSVGQTYTLDAIWTSVQWYRMALAAPFVLTAISGATGASYTAQATDQGYRLVCVGIDSAGVRRAAKAYQVVLQAPVLIQSFDSITGWSQSNTVNASFGIDTGSGSGSGKVQGSGAFLLEEQGVDVGVIKYNATTFDADWDVIAVYTDDGDGDYARNMSRGSSGVQIQSTSTNFAASSEIFDDSAEGAADDYKINGCWTAQPVADHAYLPTYSTGQTLALRVSTYKSNKARVAKRRVDALVAKARARPTYIITFDDGYVTQHTHAYPIMQKYGFAGTIFQPTANIGGAKHTVDTLTALKNAGWDIQIDGTSTDAEMTSFASLSALQADLQAQKAWMIANGFGQPRFLCYPNGSYRTAGSGGGVYVSSCGITAGSPNVVVAATNRAYVGRRMMIGGVPTDARILSVPNSTTYVLDKNAAVTLTTTGLVVDDSSPFSTGKIQSMLASEGIYAARTTAGTTFYPRFGTAGQALYLPGTSTTNVTLSGWQAGVDYVISKGRARISYFHQVYPGATGLGVDTTLFDSLMAYLTAKRDAGLIDVLTMSEWWARDGGASLPL